MMIKKTLLILTLFLGLSFIAHPSFATTVPSSPTTGGGSSGRPTIEEKLCDIRLVFCNATAIALISFSIIFLGLLILMGKLHWTFAIIMIAGMVVFVQAHNVTEGISGDPDFSVHQKCECIE